MPRCSGWAPSPAKTAGHQPSSSVGEGQEGILPHECLAGSIPPPPSSSGTSRAARPAACARANARTAGATRERHNTTISEWATTSPSLEKKKKRPETRAAPLRHVMRREGAPGSPPCENNSNARPRGCPVGSSSVRRRGGERVNTHRVWWATPSCKEGQRDGPGACAGSCVCCRPVVKPGAF